MVRNFFQPRKARKPATTTTLVRFFFCHRRNRLVFLLLTSAADVLTRSADSPVIRRSERGGGEGGGHSLTFEIRIYTSAGHIRGLITPTQCVRKNESNVYIIIEIDEQKRERANVSFELADHAVFRAHTLPTPRFYNDIGDRARARIQKRISKVGRCFVIVSERANGARRFRPTDSYYGFRLTARIFTYYENVTGRQRNMT